MIHFNLTGSPDPYTMQVANLEVAACAILLLSDGKFGLEQIGGDRSAQVPIFIHGKPDEWFRRQFERGMDDSFSHVMAAHRGDLIKALASVHIGTPADRMAFNEAIETCADEEAVMALLAEHHDSRRTSENDIGRDAWEMARQLQATAPVAQGEVH